jgi:hypothetical protein
MGVSHEEDVLRWAGEQVALLRAGRLTEIDAARIADEIESASRAEQRELSDNLALLLADLMKWQHLPSHRSRGWQYAIIVQRRMISYMLNSMPGLKARLSDRQWLNLIWEKARCHAVTETGLAYETFVSAGGWPVEALLMPDFFPE